MHCRVLPSPCSMPMPNLASAPSSAISSVTIWPVLRKATECGPWAAWIAFMRSTNVRSAASQLTGSSSPGGVAQQRRRRAVGGVEHRERFPALGARHAEIHRIVGRRREADGRAVAEVDVRDCSRSSRSRRPIRRRRRLAVAAGGRPRPKRAGVEQQLVGQRALALEQRQMTRHSQAIVGDAISESLPACAARRTR